eukprot:m.161389 g.161389  ORF g.161389 m.161389 type:complete len:123 (+) comp10285_c0_seq3:2581-2949(+)
MPHRVRLPCLHACTRAPAAPTYYRSTASVPVLYSLSAYGTWPQIYFHTPYLESKFFFVFFSNERNSQSSTGMFNHGMKKEKEKDTHTFGRHSERGSSRLKQFVIVRGRATDRPGGEIKQRNL